MSRDEVEATWAALERPGHGLTAQLHPDSRDVWLAVDGSVRRHLLVRAPDAEVGRVLMTTRGLNAEIAEIAVEGGSLDVWADIMCIDSSLNRTFVAVAADLVVDTAAASSPLTAVEQTLRTWRWFWGVESGALSEAAASGLFGEMWFLDRWAPFPDAVTAWHGPNAVRHDFSSPQVSVEVKTTSAHSVGPPRHHIATLDQLDGPEAGSLFLFSLQAIPEPSAGNTLFSVIARVRERLADRRDLLTTLDRQLALAGWSPAIADEHRTAYRVAAERLYSVEGGFPRIIRNSFVGGLPNGVDDVGYSVDLAACADWLVASTPNDAAPLLTGMS